MRIRFLLFFLLFPIIIAAQSTANFDTYANNLAGQGNWLAADGPTDAMRVYNPTGSSGSVYSNSTGNNCTYYSGTFANDQYAEATYTAETTGDKWVGVAVRINPASGGSYYGWVSDGTCSYFVEMNNGTPVPNQYPPYPISGISWTVNDVVRLEVEGTTIRFYRNGSLDVSMDGDGILTDATLTSGNPGVAGYGMSTLTRLDDWSGAVIGCPSMTGGVIAADQSINSGDNVTAFTSTSSASGGTGTITYSWFRSTATSIPDTTTWTKITDSVRTALDYGTLTASTYFFRKATAATCGTAYSNVLTVTVTTESEGEEVSTLKTFPLNIIRGDQISHDQEYILDGSCANSDSIGRIYYNGTDSVFYSGTEDYQITITSGNTDGKFKMKGQTLAVNDYTKLSHSTLYSIKVDVADTAGEDRHDTITCLIYVLEPDSTIYVDPSGVDGSGTKASPHNHITAITLNPGYTMLIKRGTTAYPTTQVVLANASNPTKWKRVGAYGTGVRPILNGSSSGSTDNRCFLIGDNSTEDKPLSSSLSTRKVAIYDIDITGYTASASQLDPITVYAGCTDIEFRRIKISGARWNGCYYIRRQSGLYNHAGDGISIILDDCEASNNTISGHGFKFEGGGVTATNIWGSGNTAGHFLDLGVWVGGNKAYYVYGNNAGTTAILIRQPKCVLKYFVIKGSGGIEVAQPTETWNHPDSAMISNGYMISDYYDGVDFKTDAGSGIQSRYDTVQRFVFKYNSSPGGAAFAGVHFRTTNTNSVVRQCAFYGNSTGILVSSANTTYLKADHNIFYGLTFYAFYTGAIGSNCKLYNNTAYNNTLTDFYNSTSTNVDFRNNSYQDRSGSYWSPSTYNYLFSTGDPYTSSGTNNFYPTVGGGLVNTGTNLGETEDIVGTVVPQDATTDIGAYEYLYPAPKPPTVILTPPGHRIIIIAQ